MGRSAIFASDLHGHRSRYEKLFSAIRQERPDLVLLGGDLLPHALRERDGIRDFAADYLFPSMDSMRREMRDQYPDIVVILGNDDYRSEEVGFIEASGKGLIHYLNNSYV